MGKLLAHSSVGAHPVASVGHGKSTPSAKSTELPPSDVHAHKHSIYGKIHKQPNTALSLLVVKMVPSCCPFLNQYLKTQYIMLRIGREPSLRLCLLCMHPIRQWRRAPCSIQMRVPPPCRLSGRSWKTSRVIGGTLPMRSISTRGPLQTCSKFICPPSLVNLFMLLSLSNTTSSQCKVCSHQLFNHAVNSITFTLLT